MRESSPAVIKPWGGYTILKKTRLFWVKKLFINKEARLSLQSHYYRNEVWFILSGHIEAQIGNAFQRATKGDVIFVPIKKKHRIIGVSKACVLEFAFGRVLERDIIRYEDDYGRT